jgi:hypothetical protein
MSISRNRGRIGAEAVSVKVLARGKRAERPVWKPFQGINDRVKDHIKGAIPADIRFPAYTAAWPNGQGSADPLFAGDFGLDER